MPAPPKVKDYKLDVQLKKAVFKRRTKERKNSAFDLKIFDSIHLYYVSKLSGIVRMLEIQHLATNEIATMINRETSVEVQDVSMHCNN